MILITGSVLLVRWVVADLSESGVADTSAQLQTPLRSRIARWFRPRRRLDYRRDKRGRFRKVRRG